MNKIRKHKALFAICFLVFMLVAVSHAKVFFRWGSRSEVTSTLKNLGGTPFYNADVEINNGPGHLTVLGFEQTLPELARATKQALNISDMDYAGGSLAIGSVSKGDKRSKLIISRLEGQSVVFLFEQSSKDWKASQDNLLPDAKNPIHLYPQSDAVFSARDNKARLGVSVSRTQDSPAGVRSYYASQMMQNGWSAPFPISSVSGSDGMTVYLKEKEVCCVQALRDGDMGGSRITILHKQLQIR